MTRETKVGLMMVALLVGVFGFLLYKRIHRPAEMLAGQSPFEGLNNYATLLAAKKDLNKTVVIRQALRLYQMVDQRLREGKKVFIEDEMTKAKSELMLL